MAKRRLYGDAAQIEALLQRMELQEKAAGGYAAVYKHPETGVFWFQCYATSAAQGGGYQLLIRLPLPSTEELIGIALQSEYEDEAVAAVMRLLDEEGLEGKDFRHELVQQLEGKNLAKLPEAEKARIRKIMSLTALTDPTNRCEVKGKRMEQLQADAAYYQNVSERALKLLKQL